MLMPPHSLRSEAVRIGPWLAFFLLLIAGGCGPRYRPELHPSTRQAPAGESFTLQPYLRAMQAGTWVYERRELPVEDNPEVTRYVRRIEPGRVAEGVLVERRFLPLQRYLPGHEVAASQPADPDLPRAPLKGGTAALFDLAEPLELIPVDLQPGQSATAASEIRFFNYRAVLRAKGTLTRTVTIEAFEDLEVPAGRFDRCLRVRIDLELSFPWLLSMDWSSTMWLSPQAGEVRHIQSMSGWFLIFWFSSGHEFRLLEHRPATLPADSAQPLSPKWMHGAVLLSREVPHPQIAGMVIDTAPPAATRPAE